MLLIAVSAGLLWAPPAASAALTSAYDFRAGSLEASFGDGGGSSPPPLKGEGTSSSTFDAGAGYVVPLSPSFPPRTWTVATVVELASLEGEQRLLDLTGGLSDAACGCATAGSSGGPGGTHRSPTARSRPGRRPTS